MEDKFIELINQNIGIAHKVCNIYFQDVDDREDVVQEMLYQLWRSYPNFRENAKFSTWMYTVCLNTAVTYFKKNKKKKEETAPLYYYHLDNERDEDDEENMLLLHQLIQNLSPLNKSIVLLFLEGIKYDEISAITGLSKTNIGVRMVRIKIELKKVKQKITSP